MCRLFAIAVYTISSEATRAAYSLSVWPVISIEMDAFFIQEVLMDTNEDARINVEQIEADFNTFLYQVQSERVTHRILH